jgi:hypothetical protein
MLRLLRLPLLSDREGDTFLRRFGHETKKRRRRQRRRPRLSFYSSPTTPLDAARFPFSFSLLLPVALRNARKTSALGCAYRHPGPSSGFSALLLSLYSPRRSRLSRSMKPVFLSGGKGAGRGQGRQGGGQGTQSRVRAARHWPRGAGREGEPEHEDAIHSSAFTRGQIFHDKSRSAP